MNTVHDIEERLGPRGTRWSRIALGVGVLGAGAAAVLGQAQGDRFARLQHSWLLACAFFLTISLGGLFFVIVQHLTRAGWSVVVRRIAEYIAANVLTVAILFVPIVALVMQGNSDLYPWADAQMVAHDPHLAHKAALYSGGFFAARCLVYFGTWVLLSRWLLSRSLAQDGQRDAAPTIALERRAPPAIIAFALTSCLAAFDFLMSLSPKWFSTIFGVYVFAGSAIAFFASAILVLRALQSAGYARHTITVEHYHDLGKFLFAFVFFWGYIAFSQFMLIWYADLPEETFWFRERLTGSWTYVSYALLFGHFVVPFAALLSRHTKRNPVALTFFAAWMLVMHALDLFWLVMPKVEADGVLVRATDVAAFVAVGGFAAFGFLKLAGNRPLVPTSDPRLAESLAFENT